MKKVIIKKLFILLMILLSFQILFVHGNNINIKNITIKIKGKEISGEDLYESIDKFFDFISKNDLEIKREKYLELLRKINFFLKKNNVNKKSIHQLNNIKFVLNYGLEKTNVDIEKFYNTTQEIILGYTEKGTKIIGYYKGNPNNGFFGIFANIHGGYEYGTYYTALYLKEELEKSGKKGWFIIPTINPDGLKVADLDLYKKKYYLKGRGNSNNIDLNRNFCTKDFKLKSYRKYSKDGMHLELKTGIDSCNSEEEVKTIIKTLDKYKFNKIISLHSEWHTLFIPTGTFENKVIINFGKELHKELPNYKFDISYKNRKEKQTKKKFYEINGEKEDKYNGTMETYIYEVYNIPIILLELEEHGKIDKKLKNIINIIN